jgi:Na+-transporting NADH:ubiquinone oxidoreductase subunit NqrF
MDVPSKSLRALPGKQVSLSGPAKDSIAQDTRNTLVYVFDRPQKDPVTSHVVWLRMSYWPSVSFITKRSFDQWTSGRSDRLLPAEAV